MTTTPIARVAAYAALAQQRGVDLIDSLAEATPVRPKRVQLHVSDLLAVLDALADACEDHQTCVACGAKGCETCGVGDLTDCDPPHCAGDSWCWCGQCRDDEARERQAEQRADIDMFGAV